VPAKKKGSKQKKDKSAKKKAAVQLGQDIWPIERDVFFRPARLKYVRKLIQPEGCVFCTTATEKVSVKTLCLYKTQYSQVVVNKFPYNSGHLLVLPLRHTGDLLSLSDAEFYDLQNMIRLCVHILNQSYQPQGYNIGLNHGASAGAGIPQHIHYHIVPRWNGDLNFFPLIAETKLVIETAESTYLRLKEFFADPKLKDQHKSAHVSKERDPS